MDQDLCPAASLWLPGVACLRQPGLGDLFYLQLYNLPLEVALLALFCASVSLHFCLLAILAVSPSLYGTWPNAVVILTGALQCPCKVRSR